jgi:NADPH2 dehydrogenase
MTIDSTPKLFQPIRVGSLDLKHRVVMAPMTRFRATKEHVPTDLMVEYYSQRSRAPGSLIITEATFISPQSGGYDNVPGIWSDAQVEGWKKVYEFFLSKDWVLTMLV